MAKKATGKKSASAKPRKNSAKRASAKKSSAGSSKRTGTKRSEAGEAFISLLQSPLVTDLVAVAATSALAALAEHGFSRKGAREEGGGKRAGKAVKSAGKAAAAAVGRRLSEEIDAIKQSAKKA